MQKPSKPKKCRVCRAEFAPSRPMQRVCSVECAVAEARDKRERAQAKQQRAESREVRQKLKRRADYTKEAQDAVNAYVRARDAGQPCISCGTMDASAWHAGHYRSVGSTPELRFNPLNIHRQCAKCNTHLSGNLIGYRRGLVDKIGADMVEWIEGPHEAQKLTIAELVEVKREFQSKLKELKK